MTVDSRSGASAPNRATGVRRGQRSRFENVSPLTIWTYGLPAVLLLLGIMHLGGWGPFVEFRKTLGEEERLQELIVDLSQENQDLQQEIKGLAQGGFGVEQRAREQLGWSRPDEIVIHLPEKR